MKSLMKAMSVDCMRNISFMAFNSIHSLNSEIKEVMKVFRESAIQNTFPPFPQWEKEPTRYVKITELAKNKKLQANIWEKVIMSTFYTLRNGRGQIILAKYS